MSAEIRVRCSSAARARISFVQRTLQAVLPYMHRIVPGVPKLFGDPGRQHHVDQELHEPCDISGSSRSLTASAA